MTFSRINTIRSGSAFSLSQIGNHVVLSDTVIPEPGVALLGSLWLIALSRRRR